MTAAKDAYYGNPNQRPPRPVFDKSAIPAVLLELSQWIVWRFTWKPDDGKWAKMPVNPHTRCRQAAKTNDSKTWATYAEAAAAANEAYLRDPSAVDGLGFVFTADGGLFGLDLDGCRNPEIGELSELATGIVKDFATYAEISPSGTGVKLIGRGTLPPKQTGKKNNKVTLSDEQEIELYDRGRYFTITGQRLPDAPGDVADCSAPLAAFIARYFAKTGEKKGKNSVSQETTFIVPASNGKLTDEAIIDKLTRSAQNAPKGAALWRGDTSGHGSDDSAADLALCNLLAFYTGPNSTDRIDSLFRQSGLYRGKWDRDDYRALTIGKALDRSEFYSPSKSGHSSDGHNAFTLNGEMPKPTGAKIILGYFHQTYSPDFRRGTSIHTRSGEWVRKADGCSLPSSALIDRLYGAHDAPRDSEGNVNRKKLPGFYRDWAPVAWGDLLATLPEEDTADLGVDSMAGDEFRRLVRDAMLSEVVLGDVIKGMNVTQTERRSLIDWCVKWAKPGSWKSIRSKKCWCKIISPTQGEILLKVAIRVELFAQLRADKTLCSMNQNSFTRRAERYGVGKSHRDERPHGHAAVVLSDDFVAGLTAGVFDPDGGEENLAGTTRTQTPDNTDQITEGENAA